MRTIKALSALLSMSRLSRPLIHILACVFTNVVIYCVFGPSTASAATSVTQYGITWTFDHDYTVGQFANGDYYVLVPNNLTIIRIDPNSTSSSGRIINGSMVNPDTNQRDGSSPMQGYDSSLTGCEYAASLNAARPNGNDLNMMNPLVITPPASLVSMISEPNAGVTPQFTDGAVLTVLATAPSANSFRPPYAGTDKTVRFTTANLDYSNLGTLPPVAGEPCMATVAGYFQRPWIDYIYNWMGRALHPANNMPNYGCDMAQKIGYGAMMLHTNHPNSMKQTLLINFVQLGIDCYGVIGNTSNHEVWPANGGHGPGRKWPILFAGLVLHDPNMQAVGVKSGDYLYSNGYYAGNPPPDYWYFGEDGDTFYVTQRDVNTQMVAWAHSPNPSDYNSNDINKPDFGITHDLLPDQGDANWASNNYRTMDSPQYPSIMLAVLVMDANTGAKALWNHNAFFDYTDRYMTTPPWPYQSSVAYDIRNSWEQNMWDTYRKNYGQIWPGLKLAAINNQLVNENNTLSFQVSATQNPSFLSVAGGNPLVTDNNNNPVTFSATGLPSGATFINQTFNWTPSSSQAGTYSVTFTANDGDYLANTSGPLQQDSNTITITVNNVNSSLALAPIGNLYFKDSLGNIKAWFDNTGSFSLTGSFAQNQAPPSTSSDNNFRVKSADGTADVMVVDIENGNAAISGTKYEFCSQSDLNQNATNFIIRSDAGDVIAYIDALGNLYLREQVLENVNP